MLVANTEGGQRFNLFEEHNPLSLKEIRKQKTFCCPECNEEVILKIGTKRIPHFSHKKGSTCSESFERESEYHINGKLQLYDWLKGKGLNPVLEPYYKEISQRPDIGVHFNGADYAIEYQCSVISEELFTKRSEAYLKIGIIPIWILAGKNIKRIGNKKVSLSGFQYLFLRKTTLGIWMIPSYCPITKSFINIHQIVPVSVKNSFSQFSITPIMKAELPDLFDPIFNDYFSYYEWQMEMRKTKNLLAQGFGAFHNKYLQELYSCSLSPSQLPPEVGLPVCHAPFIETSPVQWQGYLYMDHLMKEGIFSLNQMISSFNKRVWKGDIKIRQLPLIQSGNAILAVKEYIGLLVTLKILEKTGKGQFRRSMPSFGPGDLNQQVQVEADFYRDNGTAIVNSIKHSSCSK